LLFFLVVFGFFGWWGVFGYYFFFGFFGFFFFWVGFVFGGGGGWVFVGGDLLGWGGFFLLGRYLQGLLIFGGGAYPAYLP
ncbi:hypothetical protein AB6V47_13270, partial [Stenotrophomonas maltophilia]